MRVVLTHANVIECLNPRPIPDASVIVENGRIVDVLDGGRVPDTRDAQVIDLQGAYLLPGLWDVHIHPDYLASTGASIVEQTVQFGHRLMECLTEAGVVGVRGAPAPPVMAICRTARLRQWLFFDYHWWAFFNLRACQGM